MPTKFDTAHDFTVFLQRLLDYNSDFPEPDENDVWMRLKVGKVLGNNLIVTLPEGKQYNIQVKPVSK